MDHGHSTAQISLTNQKCMLFHGFLNTKVPDDGKTKYSGYVNVKSPLQLVSSKIYSVYTSVMCNIYCIY